jgi:membrane-anchored protein YejM (alkaline phosphatase superfamily)
VFNFMTTHQSRTSVWSHEEFEKEVGSKLSLGERHNPAHAGLAAVLSRHRRVRSRPGRAITTASRAWTRQAGEILDQLAADGLAEDTIVFFYSDHGMGMPRGKRCLQDSGLRVPLIIRFPKKWAHLAPANPGTVTDRLVSFVDFAPTVLSSVREEAHAVSGHRLPRHRCEHAA